MIKEHDSVALGRDLPEYGLARGDLGTIVHIYADGKAYEVEFMTLTGDTIGVVTLELGDVRPVTGHEIAHARQVA
jgi:ribulose-5-phosphate 4-epimerase/fuculose-1-phosphate aldolase